MPSRKLAAFSSSKVVETAQLGRILRYDVMRQRVIIVVSNSVVRVFCSFKIQEVMREFASVAYVDFGRGQTEVNKFRVTDSIVFHYFLLYYITKGYVRFEEEQGAHKVVEGMTADGAKPQLCGAETELRVLEGEVAVSI